MAHHRVALIDLYVCTKFRSNRKIFFSGRTKGRTLTPALLSRLGAQSRPKNAGRGSVPSPDLPLPRRPRHSCLLVLDTFRPFRRLWSEIVRS